MIDVSQWRASIGIWSYCQAASSRPAKGRHSHSFEAAIDDKNSGSTTSGEITSKLPAALSLIAGSSSNLIYNELHLIVCLCILLLLSGDVELNPGPIIDDQPTCLLFAKYLKPLVDWKSFALCLPGITQSDVNIIDKTRRNAQLKKKALHKRWLQVNPQASWRYVNIALKQCKENKLARDIERKTAVSTRRTCNDDMEVLANANPGPIVAGNPKDILRTHSDKLTKAISTNLYRVTESLYAEGLIPPDTNDEVFAGATGLNDFRKSSQLVNVLQKLLEASVNPEQYLIDICHVLTKQQHRTLTDIATSILHRLGQSIPVNVSSHTVLPLPADDISNTPVTNLRDKLHNLPADVTKIDETVLSVSDQLIDWKGYGLRIKLLDKLSSEIRVHVTALVGGKLFVLPENTILVSVIYAVSTSIPLLMRLELQHCVDLKNHPSMSCYLRFATASINDGSPYKLTLKKGNFKSSASSGYGSFDYNTNCCFICILGLKKGTVNGSIDHEIMQQEQKQKGSRKQHKTYQLRKYAQKECQQGKLRKHGQDKQKNESEVVGKLKTTSIMQQKQKQKGSRKQHKNYQLRKDAQKGYQQAKLRKHANGQDKQKNKGGAVRTVETRSKTRQQKSKGSDEKTNDCTENSVLSKSTQTECIEDAVIFTGLLFYESRKNLVTFAAAKDIDALIQYVEEKHSSSEKGQKFCFCFELPYIELLFGTRQSGPIIGWSVRPHMEPCRLAQRDVERFGDGFATPPTLLISVTASPYAQPSTLHYAVPVVGIDQDVTLFIQGNTTEAVGLLENVIHPHQIQQDQDTLNITYWNKIVNALEDSGFSNDNWRSLGRRLNVDLVHLNNIANNYENLERRVDECIAVWLRTGEATYWELVDALENVGEHEVARHITETLMN